MASAKKAIKKFVESQHAREPAGSGKGGQFAKKTGLNAWGHAPQAGADMWATTPKKEESQATPEFSVGEYIRNRARGRSDMTSSKILRKLADQRSDKGGGETLDRLFDDLDFAAMTGSNSTWARQMEAEGVAKGLNKRNDAIAKLSKAEMSPLTLLAAPGAQEPKYFAERLKDSKHIGSGAFGNVFATSGNNVIKEGILNNSEVPNLAIASKLGLAPKLIAQVRTKEAIDFSHVNESGVRMADLASISGGEEKLHYGAYEMENLKASGFETLELSNQKRSPELKAAIADSIGRLHAAGIAHGDWHEGNIMLNENNEVKTIDFGLSHNLDEAFATASTTEEKIKIPKKLVFDTKQLMVQTKYNRAKASPEVEKYYSNFLSEILTPVLSNTVRKRINLEGKHISPSAIASYFNTLESEHPQYLANEGVQASQKLIENLRNYYRAQNQK
jgi:ABC1 atypical kinase-like domain